MSIMFKFNVQKSDRLFKFSQVYALYTPITPCPICWGAQGGAWAPEGPTKVGVVPSGGPEETTRKEWRLGDWCLDI